MSIHVWELMFVFECLVPVALPSSIIEPLAKRGANIDAKATAKPLATRGAPCTVKGFFKWTWAMPCCGTTMHLFQAKFHIICSTKWHAKFHAHTCGLCSCSCTCLWHCPTASQLEPLTKGMQAQQPRPTGLAKQLQLRSLGNGGLDLSASSK